jgi:hypothetical protein
MPTEGLEKRFSHNTLGKPDRGTHTYTSDHSATSLPTSLHSKRHASLSIGVSRPEYDAGVVVLNYNNTHQQNTGHNGGPASS